MDHIRFNAGDMTLIISCAIGRPPSIIYWGKTLADDENIGDIQSLSMRYPVAGCADIIMAPSLAMEAGLGFGAPIGFEAHRDGKDWGSVFNVISAEHHGHSAHIICRDDASRITLEYDIIMDSQNGLFRIKSSAKNDDVIDGANDGASDNPPLIINNMFSAALPIAPHMDEIIGFTGRWAGEFQREKITRFNGTYLRENRRGRTSHDSFPAIILAHNATHENQGEAYGLHLAWSGNHNIRVDTLIDGRLLASMGAALGAGEIRLKAGETYQCPDIIAAYSNQGLSGLSRSFHDHVRRTITPQINDKARPVNYNSWEAIYFDHDWDKLKSIADKAAAIGIERFVLDDGWFGARRDATSGLGDWVVSDQIYPDGLKPLIDHITGLGMEMGLWFEPEMVNPNSDLFRAHPDWILGHNIKTQIPFRDQYVLDIARPEISQYLFDAIDALLRDHKISYIKWDMNRDLNHPADRNGYGRNDAHVRALYKLIERIKDAHPHIEVESCASGGGRADYGILQRSERIWTSDSNDAIDRQNIQKGASYFLPLCVMGSHIGPRECHITGRILPMEMRAATAIMGHMGAELNLLSEDENDLIILKQAIALYKKYRTLIHGGDMYRIDTPDYMNAFGIVAKDKSEALYSVAFLRTMIGYYPQPLRFAGLERESHYDVQFIWPETFKTATSAAFKTTEIASLGGRYSGALLSDVGMQLPASYPHNVHLIHIKQ